MYIKKYIQFFGILSALFTTACGEDMPAEEKEKEEVQETEEAAHLSELSLTSMSFQDGEETPLFRVRGGDKRAAGLPVRRRCDDGNLSQFTQKDGQYYLRQTNRQVIYILANIANQNG